MDSSANGRQSVLKTEKERVSVGVRLLNYPLWAGAPLGVVTFQNVKVEPGSGSLVPRICIIRITASTSPCPGDCRGSIPL